jgi:hypothetical protein
MITRVSLVRRVLAMDGKVGPVSAPPLAICGSAHKYSHWLCPLFGRRVRSAQAAIRIKLAAHASSPDWSAISVTSVGKTCNQVRVMPILVPRGAMLD